MKKGDIVYPNAGPHKGQPHEVIHVHDNGDVNIKPTGVRAKDIKYKLGAARAKPSEVSSSR